MREFSAYTECPQCDVVACHYLREAKAPPRREDYKTEKDYVHARIMGQHIPLPHGGSPRRPLPYDEWRSEVVRTCVACQHQWCEGERRDNSD